ncbi:MAG: hypothetical protein ACYTG2_13250 [Planctomycetota bacterium]
MLRFGEIEGMLEQAVQQALVAVGVDLDEETLGKLSAETRVRFLALREERDSLRDTVDELLKQQQELSRNRGLLRKELHLAEAELSSRDGRDGLDPQADADVAALRERLGRRLFALLAGPAGEDLARQAVAVALAAIDEHRAVLVARADGAGAAHTEQLRRRIARLRARLEESEALLARARAAAGPPHLIIGTDDHIPVDLAADVQRRELLEELLQMNIELRRLANVPFVSAQAADSPEADTRS